ncbi:hypothetical protein D3C71_2158830 [compost metagenome]
MLVIPTLPDTLKVWLTLGEGSDERDRQRHVVECRKKSIEARIAIKLLLRERMEQLA